ncbi:MAG: hypothetical protein WAM77_13090 [Xanthobacteraceae bacterium]|jgi:hypothetical protein
MATKFGKALALFLAESVALRCAMRHTGCTAGRSFIPRAVQRIEDPIDFARRAHQQKSFD